MSIKIKSHIYLYLVSITFLKLSQNSMNLHFAIIYSWHKLFSLYVKHEGRLDSSLATRLKTLFFAFILDGYFNINNDFCLLLNLTPSNDGYLPFHLHFVLDYEVLVQIECDLVSRLNTPHLLYLIRPN